MNEYSMGDYCAAKGKKKVILYTVVLCDHCWEEYTSEVYPTSLIEIRPISHVRCARCHQREGGKKWNV